VAVTAAVAACSDGGVALLHGGHGSRQLLVDRPNDLVADLDERSGRSSRPAAVRPSRSRAAISAT